MFLTSKSQDIKQAKTAQLGFANKITRQKPQKNVFVQCMTQQQQEKLEQKRQTLDSSIITFEEVVEMASTRGLEIYVRRLGPFYRVICRDKPELKNKQAVNKDETQTENNSDSENSNQILALSTGFIIPFINVLHGERLEVLSREEKGSSSKKGGILGLGFWLGIALFSYAYQFGCRKLEILSINDYDYQAERLIKYYKFFDFKIVKQVEGGSLDDLFDMLLWGGVGTRMDADIEKALIKWGPILKRQYVRSKDKFRQ